MNESSCCYTSYQHLVLSVFWIWDILRDMWGFPGGSEEKRLPAMRETRVRSLGWEDRLEKEMATHSSYSCLENSMDRGAWWATVYGVAKSSTWMKWLSRHRWENRWSNLPMVHQLVRENARIFNWWSFYYKVPHLLSTEQDPYYRITFKE